MTQVVTVGVSEAEFHRVSKVAAERRYLLRRLRPVELSTGRGQKMQVLGRIDAADLYECIHRDRVAVLYGSSVVVRRIPSAQLRENGVISLGKFVRYKGFVRSLREGDGMWLEAFDRWCEVVGCTTDSDPRCLPFQTFTARGSYDLDEARERSRFEGDHRRRKWNGRLDKRDLLWEIARPNVRHGREPIVIAGHELSHGYHWDVQGGGKISNSAMEYSFRGYINVYPDAGIRKGDDSSVIHSRRTSQMLDEEERTDAYRRQGRKPSSRRPRRK